MIARMPAMMTSMKVRGRKWRVWIFLYRKPLPVMPSTAAGRNMRANLRSVRPMVPASVLNFIRSLLNVKLCNISGLMLYCFVVYVFCPLFSPHSIEYV